MADALSILVATGGGAHSEAALRCAAHLARLGSGGVTVLAVAGRAGERSWAESVVAEAQALLAELLPGRPVQTLVRVGERGVEIPAEAARGGYTLLVLGERPRHRLLTRLLLGSVVARILQRAPCPVVLAKGQIGPVERILICDSGLVESPLLARLAEQVPVLLRAARAITVLHVMSQMGAGPGIDGRSLRASADELIQRDAPEGEILRRDLGILDASGTTGTVKVRHGLVAEEILGEAEQGAYDLVVIGGHPRTGWRNLLLDDIARQVIAGADRPVLVVRPPMETS